MRWLLLLLICGCAPDLQRYVIDQCFKVCEEHGGLDRISLFRYPFCVCEDGEWIEPKP